ncbi:MAG: hypothetical protein R3B51_11645 [Thermodesulfobacteriota bacterium]
MYGRFAGLDIGKKEVRIALINRGLREVQLLQTIRAEIGGDPTGLQENSIGNVFREYSLPRGDVAVSLTDDPVSVRVMRFPFSDPKKIDQVYEFELENISTFEPQEKIHTYHLIKNASGGEALVCVFEKEDVEGMLGRLNEEGIDPKVLTYTPAAFGSLADIVEGQRPLVLVDIGEREISFTLFDDSGFKRGRSSTRAIALFMENLGESGGGGEEDKFGFSKGKPESAESALMKEALSPIIGEIKKTVQFFENETKDKVKTILVSGSMSRIQGLTELLKKEIGRDVKKLFIPDLGVDNSPLYAKAYALALYGSSYKGGYLNFRKDQFKYQGADRELRKVFMVPAVLFVVLVALLLYNMTSRYFELKDQVSMLEAQVAREVKETFPDVQTIPRPAEYMQSEVSKVRERLSMIEGVEGASTPLEILRNISDSLPNGMSLRVNDIKIEGNNGVKVQGICDSYQEVAEIEEALSKSGKFESVIRNQTGNAVDGKTKFEISLVLKRET